MIETAEVERTSRRWVLWIALGVAVVLLTMVAFVSVSILADSSKQQLVRADAIVVFGAAQYDGRPSPVFRSRLDHADQLFRAGLAPMIITTGGSAADPKFSEGGVGHDYLMRKGVPEVALIAETQASNTSESAERLATIMHENHMNRCLAVSDAYHMFRIRKMLSHQGIEVFLAPRPDSRPKSFWSSGIALIKESLSYLAWRAGLRS